MPRNLYPIGVYLTAIVTLLDQATKWWAIEAIRAARSMITVAPFFNIKLSLNKGVTFGLLRDQSDWMPWVLIVLAVGVTLFLLRWLYRSQTMKEAVGLGLIMGGAIGNVIDRVQYGAVVDFLDFHIGGLHWYTFNLADSAIVAGVGLLLFDNFLAQARQK